MAPKLAREIPRLFRGGSKSLTFPAVAPQAPIDETSSMSRQAHAQGSIDGRSWESLKHGDESAKCYAAFVPRYRGRNCTLSSDAASGIHEPPSGGPHIGGASATPIAALSGSQHKAPGFAGGYLLNSLLGQHCINVVAENLCKQRIADGLRQRWWNQVSCLSAVIDIDHDRL
jgi:hypothetical protein